MSHVAAVGNTPGLQSTLGSVSMRVMCRWLLASPWICAHMLAWRLSHLVPFPFRYFSSQPLQSLSGVWQVSSYGRCCSSRGVISEGSLHPNGYRYVKITNTNWAVHRFVMLSFQGAPPNAQTWQVHHKDCDKQNNRLDNLEYVSPSQNMLHSYASGKRRNSGIALSKPVAWRQLGTQTWITCASGTQAAQQLGLSVSTVSFACRGQVPVKGFEFRFEEASRVSLPGEEWRPMLGPTAATAVAGRAVSSLGRVTSKRGVIGTGCLTPNGYCITTISTSLGSVQVPVHRLVALAFLEPPKSNSMINVNHKDLDKRNNCVGNLEWASQSENMAHFHANSSVVRVTGLKPVFSRLQGSSETWKLHPSMSRAASKLGVHRGNISKCVKGACSHTGGYEFKLVSPVESLPGEEWRVVDLDALRHDRKARTPWFTLQTPENKWILRHCSSRWLWPWLLDLLGSLL